MLVPVTTHKIQIVCPICKTRDLIGVPKRELNKSSHLTTISIQKGLICSHHFQVFVDKNLQIRGQPYHDIPGHQPGGSPIRMPQIGAASRRQQRRSFQSLRFSRGFG